MKNRSIALNVAALSALGPFSIDTYFPSFPALAAHFAVTELQVQSTLGKPPSAQMEAEAETNLVP